MHLIVRYHAASVFPAYCEVKLPSMLRIVWSVVGSLVFAYACVLALVYLFQARLLSFPEQGRAVVATPQAYGLTLEPVTIVTEDRERLAAWWVPAENAVGTVLFFHG